MFVLYKSANRPIDPRHKVLDTVWGFTLAEVGDPEWIDWGFGFPEIVPDNVAKMYNFFGRPFFKGYQDKHTGEIYYSKGLTSGREVNKVERPFTEEESADVLAYMKILLKARVNDVYEQRYRELSRHVHGFEFDTWPQQLAEANAGGGVLLEAMAKSRGINVSTLAEKIKAKSAEYYKSVGVLLGQKQRHHRDIDACTTLREAADVADVKFGINKHPDFGPSISGGDFKVHI